MPIWLRRFTLQSIKEFYDKEKEAHEEMMNKAKGTEKLTSSNQNIVSPPKVKPTYTTKASTK